MLTDGQTEALKKAVNQKPDEYIYQTGYHAESYYKGFKDALDAVKQELEYIIDYEINVDEE